MDPTANPPESSKAGLAARHGRVGEIYDTLRKNNALVMSPTGISVLATLIHNSPDGCCVCSLHKHMCDEFNWPIDTASAMIFISTDLREGNHIRLRSDNSILCCGKHVIPTTESCALANSSIDFTMYEYDIDDSW